MTFSLDELFSSFRERSRAALLERCAKNSVTVCPQVSQDSYMRDLGMVYDWLSDLYDGKPDAMLSARKEARDE